MATCTAVKSTQKTSKVFKSPKKYTVRFFNDDVTPMDYVMALVMKVFHVNETDAKSFMLDVHTKGSQTIGSYSREIAETKVHHINSINIVMKQNLKTAVEEK